MEFPPRYLTTERAVTSDLDTWKDISKRCSKWQMHTVVVNGSSPRYFGGSNAISEAFGLGVLCRPMEVGSIQGAIVGSGRG